MNFAQKLVNLAELGHAAGDVFVRLSGGNLSQEC